MKTKTIFIIAISLMCSSMAWTQKKSGGVVTGYSNTTVVNVPQHFQGTLIAPTLCDYEILTESSVLYTFNSNILITEISAGSLKDWAEELALQAQSKLITEYKADAIISLTHEISTSLDGKLIVLVRGFPVKYVNFRPATKNDLWMLDFYTQLDRELKTKDLKGRTETKTEVVDK